MAHQTAAATSLSQQYPSLQTWTFALKQELSFVGFITYTSRHEVMIAELLVVKPFQMYMHDGQVATLLPSHRVKVSGVRSLDGGEPGKQDGLQLHIALPGNAARGPYTSSLRMIEACTRPSDESLASIQANVERLKMVIHEERGSEHAMHKHARVAIANFMAFDITGVKVAVSIGNRGMLCMFHNLTRTVVFVVHFGNRIHYIPLNEPQARTATKDVPPQSQNVSQAASTTATAPIGVVNNLSPTPATNVIDFTEKFTSCNRLFSPTQTLIVCGGQGQPIELKVNTGVIVHMFKEAENRLFFFRVLNRWTKAATEKSEASSGFEGGLHFLIDSSSSAMTKGLLKEITEEVNNHGKAKVEDPKV